MARTIGPNSFLPGHALKLDEACTCDHCGQPATISIVLETDSSGSEVADLCATHATAVQKGLQEARQQLQRCDWCQTMAEGCEVRRDPEEGAAGPVYLVCPSCWAKRMKEMGFLLSEEEEEGDDDISLDINPFEPDNE